VNSPQDIIKVENLINFNPDTSQVSTLKDPVSNMITHSDTLKGAQRYETPTQKSSRPLINVKEPVQQRNLVMDSRL